MFSFSLKSDGALYSRTQYKPVVFFWIGYASDFSPQGFSCTIVAAILFNEGSVFFLGGFIVLLREHRGKNHHQFIIVHDPCFIVLKIK